MSRIERTVASPTSRVASAIPGTASKAITEKSAVVVATLALTRSASRLDSAIPLRAMKLRFDVTWRAYSWKDPSIATAFAKSISSMDVTTLVACEYFSTSRRASSIRDRFARPFFVFRKASRSLLTPASALSISRARTGTSTVPGLAASMFSRRYRSASARSNLAAISARFAASCMSTLTISCVSSRTWRSVDTAMTAMTRSRPRASAGAMPNFTISGQSARRGRRFMSEANLHAGAQPSLGRRGR